MPYEISLDRDAERALDRYTITLGEEFGPTQAHELADWLAVASQNPTATFRIDVSRTQALSCRHVQTLLARCAWLRTRRRVEVVRRQLAALTVVGAESAFLLG
jgi:hypothetical protein